MWGAVRGHTDLCQWLGQAWVSSTEWQTCRRQDESQWCYWAEPGGEPTGTPLRKWWWSQIGELQRKERFGWTSEDVRLNTGTNNVNDSATICMDSFLLQVKSEITLQRRIMFYPFQGIRPPAHVRSSAADSSLCPTVEAGFYFLHSVLHHLLSSSSYETTSSGANWKCSK